VTISFLLPCLAIAAPQRAAGRSGAPRPLEWPPERNLALAAPAGGFKALDGDRLLVNVSESAQGAGSLNGDADVTDEVMFAIDLASGTAQALGAANPASTAFVGEYVLLALLESANGPSDLNGDGDTLDQVLHSFDGTNLVDLDLAGRLAVARGDFALVLGNEFQGPDLNGDGDRLDEVAFLFDGRTGALSSLALTTGPTPAAQEPWDLGDELAALSVPEALQGNLDRNGDGDTLDFVPVVVELASASTSYLPFALDRFTPPAVNGNLVAFALAEADQGFDANGDGDLADFVAHVHDHALALTRDTGGTVTGFGVPDLRHDVLAGSGFAVFESPLTATLQLHVAATGLTTDTGLSGGAVSVRDGILAKPVFEGFAGGDLNGDGDTLDSVMHVLEAPAFVARNLRLDSTAVRIGEGWVVLAVPEWNQGVADRNGDGDHNDSVLAAVDLRHGPVRNLGIAGVPFRGADDLFWCNVDEGDQAQDQNGDGDLADFHPLIAQPSSGWRRFLPDAFGLTLGERWFVYTRREALLGADRNGDGDLLDRVVHVQFLGKP
jgi:hypothetical protein